MTDPAKPRRRARRARPVATAPDEPATVGGSVDERQVRAARRALAGGGALVGIGLAIVGIGPSEAGQAITLAGLVATMYGVHAYGRLGPDEGAA